MVVVGLVKYKYLRNYSANCLNTGIVYILIYLFKCMCFIDLSTASYYRI